MFRDLNHAPAQGYGTITFWEVTTGAKYHLGQRWSSPQIELRGSGFRVASANDHTLAYQICTGWERVATSASHRQLTPGHRFFWGRCVTTRQNYALYIYIHIHIYIDMCIYIYVYRI